MLKVQQKRQKIVTLDLNKNGWLKIWLIVPSDLGSSHCTGILASVFYIIYDYINTCMRKKKITKQTAVICTAVKPVLKVLSKIDKTKVLKTGGLLA